MGKSTKKTPKGAKSVPKPKNTTKTVTKPPPKEEEFVEEFPENSETSSDDESESKTVKKRTRCTRQKWTKEMESKLCQLWEEERHMYDTTCADYRNTFMRAAAIRRMSIILKVDADDVEVHLRSLRTAFKKLKLPSGASADHLSWRQQEINNLCGFLRIHLQNRDSSSNLDDKVKKKKPNKPSDDSKKANAKEPEEGTQSKKAADAGAKEKSDDSVDPTMIADNIDDNLSENEDDNIVQPKPGGSSDPKYSMEQKKPKYNKTRKRTSDEEKNSNNEDPTDMPAYYVVGKRRKAEEAKKKAELSGMLEDRNEMLHSLTSSVSTLANTGVGQKKDDPPNVDSYDMWAKLLAEKLREMDKKVAQRFKVHVDTIALDAIDGDWPPKK